MTKFRNVFIAVAALVAFNSAASAQGVDPQCSALSTTSQDACQKAIDLFKYLAPQLGTSITGGNATLGVGGTLGGLGHFSIGVRGNLIPKGSLPKTDEPAVQPGIAGPEQDTYTVEDQILGLPAVDASFGLFKGLPLGFTNLGGLDLIVSANYLPEVDGEDLSIKVPNGSLKLGYGGRLGIIQETPIWPAVSVTYLRRDLPKVDILSQAGSDSINISGFEVKTTAWRLVASKKFFILGLALGAGQDKYDSKADARTYISATSTTAGPIHVAQNLTRTNVFGDVSINLPLLKIIGEVGQVSGGKISTYNKFDGTDADASRTYASLGIRLGW